MRGTECSMCRHRAAWLIDTEVFCEGQTELIIDAAGVNRFRISRLTEAEKRVPEWRTSIESGGLKRAKEKLRWRSCSNFPLSRAFAAFH